MFTAIATNPVLSAIIASCAYFVLSLLVGWIILFLHDLVTPGYKTWVEVHSGNVAVGIASAGQIIGIGIILQSAIGHNVNLLWSLAWGLYGGLLQILGYLLFELLTPKLPVGQELANGNRAVGLISGAISIGVSMVIAACIA